MRKELWKKKKREEKRRKGKRGKLKEKGKECKKAEKISLFCFHKNPIGKSIKLIKHIIFLLGQRTNIF